jgi:hypothetical protein
MVDWEITGAAIAVAILFIGFITAAIVGSKVNASTRDLCETESLTIDRCITTVGLECIKAVCKKQSGFSTVTGDYLWTYTEVER